MLRLRVWPLKRAPFRFLYWIVWDVDPRTVVQCRRLQPMLGCDTFTVFDKQSSDVVVQPWRLGRLERQASNTPTFHLATHISTFPLHHLTNQDERWRWRERKTRQVVGDIVVFRSLRHLEVGKIQRRANHIMFGEDIAIVPLMVLKRNVTDWA